MDTNIPINVLYLKRSKGSKKSLYNPAVARNPSSVPFFCVGVEASRYLTPQKNWRDSLLPQPYFGTPPHLLWVSQRYPPYGSFWFLFPVSVSNHHTKKRFVFRNQERCCQNHIVLSTTARQKWFLLQTSNLLVDRATPFLVQFSVTLSLLETNHCRFRKPSVKNVLFVSATSRRRESFM